jgi:hypothetical protein
MIVVWSGKGKMVLLILVLCFIPLVLIALFSNHFIPEQNSSGANLFLAKNRGWLLGLTFISAGVANWLYGRRLNGQPAQEGIDPMTGIKKMFRPSHALYWIKIEYWGVFFFLTGLYFLLFMK